MTQKTICIVPYSQAFIRPDGLYRDCCSTSPQQTAFELDFNSWWQGTTMNNLRNSVQTSLPEHCRRCHQHEQANNESMRLAVNKDNATFDIRAPLPNRYQIAFGNLCNLGCWSCDENLSSVIQEEKRRLNLLPANYQDPSIKFSQAWPSLQEAIIKSYDYHDEILINIWGGEPTISKEFVAFLETLVKLDLSKRTRIEMFTNCHSPKEGFQDLLRNNPWAHITILASIDAVGEANDWIRYGSTWSKVYDNFCQFKQLADYIEIQCTLSVLNARYVPELSVFVAEHQTKLTLVPLQDPWFMNVSLWDGSLDVLGSAEEYQKHGLESYWNLYASAPKAGAKDALRDHLNQFTNRLQNKLFV